MGPRSPGLALGLHEDFLNISYKTRVAQNKVITHIYFLESKGGIHSQSYLCCQIISYWQVSDMTL